MLRSGLGTKFWRNFIVVARANVIAQLLLVGTAPLLAFVFSPEHFGIAASFAALLQIIGAFATWKLDWSIPNARTLQSAATLLLLGVISLAAISSIVLVLILAYPNMFASYDVPKDLLKVLPIALLGYGLVQLSHGWFIREADLTFVSRARLVQTFSHIGASLALGLSGLGAAGLIVGNAVSYFCSLPTLLLNAKVRILKGLASIGVRSLKHAASRFLAQATLSSAVSTLNAIANNAPVLILAVYFSSFEVGLFAFVYRLVATPVGAVSAALAQSFWAHAAELKLKGSIQELRANFLQITKLLAGFAVIVTLACLIVSRFLGYIFGDEWRPAESVMVMQIPMLWGLIIVSPTNHLIVFGKQGLQLLADITRVVLIICSGYLAFLQGASIELAVFMIAVSSLVGHVVLFCIHLYVHKRSLG